jgi:hypothetical protein
MSFKFAYKVGHNQPLSVAEFTSLGDDFKISGGFIFSNADLEISKTGSLVYKTLILKELPETLPKKIGFVSLDGDKDIIKKLKEKGAKKILLQNKYPNAGHFKYVKNWFIHRKIEGGEIYLEVLEYQDADQWSKIDMGLPAKDMKRGIINLKLARSMYNLIQNKDLAICDPFAGLGRNAVAIWDLNKNFYLSDIDKSCEELINKNINWIQENFPSDSKVLKITTQDASKLELVGVVENFVIVTEGYLTTVLHDQINSYEATKRLDDVKDFWLKTLKNWVSNQLIKEVVFCLPYYIMGQSKFNIKVEDIIPVGFEEVGSSIFYDRVKSRVGHQIVHLVRKAS